MSFTAFKEVNINNPGSTTRYGSDDLLDFYKILNGKTTANRRPEIINRWRWSNYQEFKTVTEASVPDPTETDVVHFFVSQTDKKLKVKKSGGITINLEDVGAGSWNPTSSETLQNKTINFDLNTIKHSTTNGVGDILRYDGVRMSRLAKGTGNQMLAVNAAGTDLEWQTPAGGGGGGGEANTASNVGTQGIGVFYQKLGVDLQFKSIFSPDGSILISDDTGNQKVDISLGSGIVKTNQSNVFGDFQQTFRSGRLAITNPAGSFGYFFVGNPIVASRNIVLPLLTANDNLVTEAFVQPLTNKTIAAGCVINTDIATIKHSTTNQAGDLIANTGTQFDRLARGGANQHLMMNSAGTGLMWGTFTAGGTRLPFDGAAVPQTGRWGAFYGGAGNGDGMMGFAHTYNRLHGSASSTSESATEIYTAASVGAIAEFKTACGFRRDSSCIFKAKWRLTSTSACKVKIGVSNATAIGAGGSGTGGSTVRYDVTQNSSSHSEMDTINRFGIRFNAGAGGLNEAVTEVIVRFRKSGTPSGSATVGIRKGSDGTLVTLGSFTPNSFGSGEQAATISAASNTYQMVSGDYVTVEFPANSSDFIELDQDDAAPPSGFSMHQWVSSWSSYPDTLAMKITTTAITAGGNGDTPLNAASGIMVHGSIGTHTNYRVARNDGSPTQTSVDSGKALANLTDHTVEININSTNCIVTLDGTAFTYTTVVPAVSTPVAWFMQVETASAAEKGLGIVYAQVVTTL
jgi:hypothetical protein